MSTLFPKKVNIYANRPITVLSVPIRGNIFGANLTEKQLLAVICAHGIVDEVLEDGSTVRLDMANYNKDNSSESVKAKAAAEKKIKEAAAKAQALVEAAAAKAKKEAQEKLLAIEKAKKEAEVKAAQEIAAKEAEAKAKIVALKRAAIEKNKKYSK